MRTWIRLKRDIQYELLIVPALALFVVFFVLPAIETLRYSFTDFNGYAKTYSYVGISNYVNVLKDKSLVAAIAFTVFFAVCYTILQNACGMALALALDKKTRSNNLLRTIFFMPSVFSSLVIGFIWSYILSSSKAGLLNHMLAGVGLGALQSNWLGSPDLAKLSVVFVAVWQSAGWAMVIYLANLQSVPQELLEAADIDGANGWQKFFNITLRMMAPSLTINSLVSMIGGLKVYDYVVALTGGGPGYATETITTSIMRLAFTLGDYGYGSALAMVMFVIIFVIALVQLFFLHKGEESVYGE